MKSPHTTIRPLLALAAILLTGTVQSLAQDTAQRIGIYDSRAVAIAYAGSTSLRSEMQELTTKHKKAKDAGDEKEAARIEAQAQAKQAKLHQQGFSTAPVDDILAHIASDLPKIQTAAGVSAIVSKWDHAAIGKHPRAEKVDLTMQLVDAFRPGERARSNAIAIQKKEPIPLDRLGSEH